MKICLFLHFHGSLCLFLNKKNQFQCCDIKIAKKINYIYVCVCVCVCVNSNKKKKKNQNFGKVPPTFETTNSTEKILDGFIVKKRKETKRG